jgi:hypothetical protein
MIIGSDSINLNCDRHSEDFGTSNTHNLNWSSVYIFTFIVEVVNTTRVMQNKGPKQNFFHVSLEEVNLYRMF